MKLIPVSYFGFTAMDRRFSSPMLPWIVSEIRKRDYSEKLSLGIEDGVLQAYNPDFELQFSHKIWQVTRFSQADQDPTTFLYLMRDDSDTLLYCYLFQAKKSADVLHVIDRVLDPMVYTSSYPNPTAYTFLSHHYKWKIGSRNVMNFLHKVQLHGKDDLYRKGGGHTFFVPIDHKTDDYKWENIDGYIIEGHVVPNMVLFTRPTQRNFIFETAANGDYIYIVLSLVTSGGKDFVKSHTILGNSNHKKGEVLSEIVKANIPVANGVVHLIKQPLAVFDRELKPFPYLPVFYKVASDPNLSHTFNIGRRNRMNKIFKNESALYTFFVPTNRAWRNYLNYTHHEQGQILKRHVVVSDSRLSMAKLAILSKNGGGEATLNTLDGTIKLTVTQKNGTYSMTWNNRSIGLSRPDYECSNGVVHVLDDVLADVRTSSDTSHDSERVSFWGALKNLVL